LSKRIQEKISAYSLHIKQTNLRLLRKQGLVAKAIWTGEALVVIALSPMLRRQPKRNLGDNNDTTRHLSGRSVRVLAFGLGFMPLGSCMATRDRAAGKSVVLICGTFMVSS
jgi:glycine cleavage system protein P-like pyridoxal-binding family